MSPLQDDALAVLVRRALAPLAGSGLVVSAAALLAGVPAALGALVGTGLVSAFFASTLLLMRVTAAMDPRLTLGVALLAYWVKACVLGGVLLLSPVLTWFDPLWFGGVVVAGTLAWMALHVRALAGVRILAFQPADGTQGRAS
ncbi:hypothetical protein [Thalassiella azotivora]